MAFKIPEVKLNTRRKIESYVLDLGISFSCRFSSSAAKTYHYPGQKRTVFSRVYILSSKHERRLGEFEKIMQT